MARALASRFEDEFLRQVTQEDIARAMAVPPVTIGGGPSEPSMTRVACLSKECRPRPSFVHTKVDMPSSVGCAVCDGKGWTYHSTRTCTCFTCASRARKRRHEMERQREYKRAVAAYNEFNPENRAPPTSTPFRALPEMYGGGHSPYKTDWAQVRFAAKGSLRLAAQGAVATASLMLSPLLPFSVFTVAMAGIVIFMMTFVRYIILWDEPRDAKPKGCPAHPHPGTARVRKEWLDRCTCRGLSLEEQCKVIGARFATGEIDQLTMEQEIEATLKASDWFAKL